MAFALDCGLIIIALIVMAICTIRGFLACVLSLGKTVLAAIAAFLFGDLVASWIASGPLGTSVTNTVYGFFRGLYDTGAEVFDLSRAVSKLPDSIRFVLKCLNVSTEEIQAWGTQTAVGEDGLREFSATVSGPIVSFISTVLGFIAVFVCCLILFEILILLAKIFTKLPVIRWIDRLGGLSLGIVMAGISLLVVSSFVAAILAYISVSYPDSAWAGVYEQTSILQAINRLIGYGT